jgi:hypothetical protein
MINLKVVGALDRCTTFDRPLDASSVKNIRVIDENTRAFVVENLEALRRRNSEPELQSALRRVLRRAYLDRALERIKKKANKKIRWASVRIDRFRSAGNAIGLDRL